MNNDETNDNEIMVPALPTELAKTLGELEAYYKLYLRPTYDEGFVALVLWTAHTHAVVAADVTPYIRVTSPEKLSGKSRAGETANLVTKDPWLAIMPSSAVLYRKIQQNAPTLILDESDRLFAGDKEYQQAIIGVLNGGYSRGVTVPRVGTGGTLIEFNVFCPKMIIGIGDIPDTIASRCIPFVMRRKLPDENVQRFRKRQAELEAAPIRKALPSGHRTQDSSRNCVRRSRSYPKS